MTTKDLWKSLGTAFELWLFYNIVAALFNLDLFSGNILSIIGAWGLLAVCLFVFFSTMYKRLKKNVLPAVPKIYKDEDIQTVKQARKAVSNTQPKAFKKEMRSLDSQVERMTKKTETLDQALKDYFGDSKISYEKFARTIDAVQKVFLDNTQRIVNRINIFDEEGYKSVFAKHLEYTSAINPYNEHFDYVRKRLDENEMILQKMDRLLLEVNQLNETQTPIEQLPVMQEINELIEQTKLYKTN